MLILGVLFHKLNNNNIINIDFTYSDCSYLFHVIYIARSQGISFLIFCCHTLNTIVHSFWFEWSDVCKSISLVAVTKESIKTANRFKDRLHCITFKLIAYDYHSLLTLANGWYMSMHFTKHLVSSIYTYIHIRTYVLCSQTIVIK